MHEDGREQTVARHFNTSTSNSLTVFFLDGYALTIKLTIIFKSFNRNLSLKKKGRRMQVLGWSIEKRVILLEHKHADTKHPLSSTNTRDLLLFFSSSVSYGVIRSGLIIFFSRTFLCINIWWTITLLG